MFLAAIYPLSERSAVNLMGKVNSGNTTGYEEQSTFESVGNLETDIEQNIIWDDQVCLLFFIFLKLYLLFFDRWKWKEIKSKNHNLIEINLKLIQFLKVKLVIMHFIEHFGIFKYFLFFLV